MISKKELIEIAEELGYIVRNYGEYIEVCYKPNSTMWDDDYVDPSIVVDANYDIFNGQNKVLNIYKLIKRTEKNKYKLVGESDYDYMLPKEGIYNILKNLYMELKDTEQQYNLDLIKGDFDVR